MIEIKLYNKNKILKRGRYSLKIKKLKELYQEKGNFFVRRICLRKCKIKGIHKI